MALVLQKHRPGGTAVAGLRLALLLPCALFLSACSIENTDSEERTLPEDELYSIELTQHSPLQQAFMQDCLKCVLGELSSQDQIIAQYQASYLDDNFPEPLALQQYMENHFFESCVQKAMQQGKQEAFAALITRPVRAARIAQRFYMEGKLSDGAFWLQRVINLQGEKNGMATAGRIFVSRRETVAIGARLLQQSARLGSHEASQILLSLTMPGSSYYQDLMHQSETKDAPK